MVIRRPAALHATSERLETRTYALKPPPPPWLLNRPHVGVGCCRSRYANGARLGASARREQPALRSSSVSPFWANRSTRQASSSPCRNIGEEGGRQAPSQAPAGHGWSIVVLSSHSASNSSESVPRGDVPRLAGTAAMERSAPAVTRISNVGPAACWKPSRHAPHAPVSEQVARDEGSWMLGELLRTISSAPGVSSCIRPRKTPLCFNRSVPSPPLTFSH